MRRVRLTFAALVVIAVAAVGVVGRALTWPASPAAGLTLAAGGLVAVAAAGLALRILVVLDGGR